MREVRNPDVQGQTIFCDDIRNEVGGKITYVGVYKGIIAVHDEFPVSLPKFAFGISFRQRATNVVSPVKLRIYLPGDEDSVPSIEGELTLDSTQPDPGASLGPDPFVSAEASLIFAPLQLKQPGFIKVRALRGDEIYRLGSLSVVKRAQAT